MVVSHCIGISPEPSTPGSIVLCLEALIKGLISGHHPDQVDTMSKLMHEDVLYPAIHTEIKIFIDTSEQIILLAFFKGKYMYSQQRYGWFQFVAWVR